MQDWTLVASLLRQWANAPLERRPEEPGPESLAEPARVIRDTTLRHQVERLLALSGSDWVGPARPEPEPAGSDDLTTAVYLLAELLAGGLEAGSTATDADVTRNAHRLADLAESSMELKALDLDGICLSQAIARLVRFGTESVSEERIGLLHRLIALDPATVMPRSYLLAFQTFADAVVEAGRSDRWLELLSRFHRVIGAKAPGDILVNLAAFSRPVMSEDARWYRANQVWDLADALIDDSLASEKPYPVEWSDPLRIELTLSYLTNRDLDEHPFIDIVAEAYGRVVNRVQTAARPDALANFALFLTRTTIPPELAVDRLRYWIGEAIAEQEQAAQRNDDEIVRRYDMGIRAARMMGLLLDVRSGAVARVMETIDDTELPHLLDQLSFIAADGLRPSLADALEARGLGQDDPHTATAFRLAAAAVIARTDPAGGAARFGALGGLGSPETREPEELSRFRFDISQALMPEDEPPDGVATVPGIPVELYSDDPFDRLWVMETQLGPALDLTAVSREEFVKRLPFLVELYTRGIADIDEQVVEAAVGYSRMIIVGLEKRGLRAEALDWARTVATDLDHATGPRGRRAYAFALHDIVRNAGRREAEAAAADLRAVLEENDSDYAIVLRALLAESTWGWEPDEERRYARLDDNIVAAIEAIEYDEHEEHDWPGLIRAQADRLFGYQASRGNWPDAVRAAGIVLDWSGPGRLYELFAINHLMLLLSLRLVEMDEASAANARRLIREVEERIEVLGPSESGLLAAHTTLVSRGLVHDPESASAFDDYHLAIVGFQEETAHYLAVADATEAPVLYATLLRHTAELVWGAWREAEESHDPLATRWWRTARALVLYLDLGVPASRRADDPLVRDAVELAASGYTFMPLADLALVKRLYATLTLLVNEERDRVEAFAAVARVVRRLR